MPDFIKNYNHFYFSHQFDQLKEGKSRSVQTWFPYEHANEAYKCKLTCFSRGKYFILKNLSTLCGERYKGTPHGSWYIDSRTSIEMDGTLDFDSFYLGANFKH